MRIALLFIMVFWSDDSSYRLFKILWILHLRPLIFNAPYHILDTHFLQLQTWVSQPRSSCIQLYYLNQTFKTYICQAWLPSICPPLAFVTRQDLNYLMRKLTFFTKEGGQLHSTSFSTSLSTVVLKAGKSHASISRQSVNMLDNVSCVYINEWKYVFQVTYII